MTNITPDIIGRIPSALPTYDEEGNELTTLEWADGYHINTPEPIPGWEQFRIPTPETPYRVYAGGIMPVCYRFESEAQFLSMIPQDELEE